MGIIEDVSAAKRLLGEVVAETLWPTRCAVCDTPGEVLCERCRLTLPYLDQLQACPTCGAAGGQYICCECNSFTLKQKGLSRFPLAGCVSATMLTPETHRVITIYKDRGDRALSRIMAACMANVLPPTWTPEATLVPIPARPKALRERGFDHMALITKELCQITGLPSASALVPQARRDQRALDARQRLANMRGSLGLRKEYMQGAQGARGALGTQNASGAQGVRGVRSPQDAQPLGTRVILVDDVFTTGATLFAAAEVLHAAGVREVFALTFARA